MGSKNRNRGNNATTNQSKESPVSTPEQDKNTQSAENLQDDKTAEGIDQVADENPPPATNDEDTGGPIEEVTTTDADLARGWSPTVNLNVNAAPVAESEGAADKGGSSEIPPAPQPPVEAKEVKVASGTIVDKTAGQLGQTASAAAVQAITQESTAKPADTRSDFDKLVADIQANGTSREKYVATFMQEYVAKMAPGTPVSVEEGVRNQKVLWRTIKNVVENQEGFKEAFHLLVGYFREYRTTTLSESYAYRFMENITLQGDELQAFQRMINVLQVAGGVNQKSDVFKLVDLNTTITVGLSEDARNAVIRYFRT